MVDIYNKKLRQAEKLPGGETYKMKLNSEVMLPIFATNLYTYAVSAFRELVANAMRSCRLAESQGLVESGEIKITVNSDRMLIIEDNGIGITEDVFKESVVVLGNSTNFDRKEAGQFGMGTGGYPLLSGILYIDTMTHDGRGFSAVGRDGLEFTKYDKTERKTPGTTLRMMLYAGEEKEDGTFNPNISLRDIYEMAGKIGRVSNVKMVVDMTEATSTAQLPRDVVVFEPRGLKGLVDEYDTAVYHDGEDIEMVVIPMKNPVIEQYLIGMPIKARTESSLGLVINIKDEGKYPPMPYREKLTLAASKKLQKTVDSELCALFAKIADISNHEKYVESEHKDVFRIFATATEKVYSMYGSRAGKACRLHDTILYWSVFMSDHNDAATIGMMLLDKNPVFMRSKNRKLKKAIENNIPDAVVYWPRRSYAAKARVIAEKWGIPVAQKVLAARKIDISSGTQFSSMICHSNTPTHGYSSYDMDYILGTPTIRNELKTMKIVMADSVPLGDLLSVIKKYKSEILLTKYSKAVSELERSIPFSEWAATLGSRTVSTNKGNMTLDKVQAEKRYFVYDGNPAKIKDLASLCGDLIIMSGASIFEAIVYCDHTGSKNRPVVLDEDSFLEHVFNVGWDGARLDKKSTGYFEYAHDYIPKFSQLLGLMEPALRALFVHTMLYHPQDDDDECILYSFGEHMIGYAMPKADSAIAALIELSKCANAYKHGDTVFRKRLYKSIWTICGFNNMWSIDDESMEVILQECVLKPTFQGIEVRSCVSNRRTMRYAYDVEFDADSESLDFSKRETVLGSTTFHDVRVEMDSTKVSVRARIETT